METFWIILFYVLLVDAIGANIVAWTKARKWYKGNCCIIAHFFPATKGWVAYYLILVLIIGYLVHNFVSPVF